MRKVHDIFHVSLLEPYRGDPARALNPGLILLNGIKEYAIKQVLRAKETRHDGTRFECKWFG